MNKRALSPLVATILLVVFALVIGTVTMNWGKNYVEKANFKEDAAKKDNSVVISVRDLNSGNTELKDLMIKYITGSLSEDEYFRQEKMMIGK